MQAIAGRQRSGNEKGGSGEDAGSVHGSYLVSVASMARNRQFTRRLQKWLNGSAVSDLDHPQWCLGGLVRQAWVPRT